MVDQAFNAMMRGRSGPAAIILPQDLMAEPAAAPASGSPIELLRIGADETGVQEAKQLLLKSKRPIILAGGGAVWSSAGKQIEELARKLQCPVITTLNGKGIVDERSPQSLGHGRSVRSMAALAHADVMLAVGCRFTEVFTYFGKVRP